MEPGETAHRGILQNFWTLALHGAPPIAPGEEGIRELTPQTRAQLSSWTDTWAELPLDEALFERLCRSVSTPPTKRRCLSPTVRRRRTANAGRCAGSGRSAFLKTYRRYAHGKTKEKLVRRRKCTRYFHHRRRSCRADRCDLASRAGVKPLVLESLTCGGQVITTSEIENYPAITKIEAGALPMNCAARRRRLARRSARSG